MPKPEITIIIPAYNEEQVIKASIARLADYIKKNKLDCELLIVNDASTDGTGRILASLSLPSYARVITNKIRQGKGKSISNAMLQSKGKTIIFLDADLSFGLDVIDRLLDAIKNGADIAIGSRFVMGSTIHRSFIRRFFSSVYNLLVRLFLDSNVHDHQVGSKAFKGSTVLPLLPLVKAKQFFWDTELLIVAKRKNMKIVEVPITWWEGTQSSINPLTTSFSMLYDMFAFRLRKNTVDN
ncbi:MAG: glycosyltransferase [Candidatus Bilamarchaeaceae archaeon]